MWHDYYYCYFRAVSSHCLPKDSSRHLRIIIYKHTVREIAQPKFDLHHPFALVRHCSIFQTIECGQHANNKDLIQNRTISLSTTYDSLAEIYAMTGALNQAMKTMDMVAANSAENKDIQSRKQVLRELAQGED